MIKTNSRFRGFKFSFEAPPGSNTPTMWVPDGKRLRTTKGRVLAIEVSRGALVYLTRKGPPARVVAKESFF